MSQWNGADEVNHLVREAASGQEKALSTLLVSFHPLIRKNAANFSGGDEFLYDDLFQEGMVALCRAVVRYDEQRGPFPAFASRCVRNAMISLMRKRPREVLLDDFEDAAHVSPDAQTVEDMETRDDLRLLIEELSPMETAVLDAFLQSGSTAAAIRILGWPRKKVENALARIRRKYQVLHTVGDGNSPGSSGHPEGF